MKQINLNKSVYELSQAYPELLELLDEIGFHDIKKPGMISTVGRFMTIPKGATAKKIDIDIIKEKLTERGFEIIDK